MKLILPDGSKLELDTSLKYEEKRSIVDQILEDWDDYFTTYKHTKKTTVCLEVLTNYLYYHKEQEDNDNDENK